MLYKGYVETKGKASIEKLKNRTTWKTYIELLKKIFDKKFMRTLKSAGKAAYNGGIAWLYPYYNERGEFPYV